MPTRRRHSVRKYRRPFPAEPAVVFGEFSGRKLSELTDEELVRFLYSDATRQHQKVLSIPGLPPLPTYLDLSHYWFVKYELERRKPESRLDTNASLDILATDNEAAIALKLVEFGYRAASRKHHPDKGGATSTMQKVNAARHMMRRLLKSIHH